MGLYVYGALLMAMSFVTGVLLHNNSLAALAAVACASAALAEAANDVFQSPVGARFHSGPTVVNALAVLSWVLTASAAILTVSSLMGAL